MKKILCPVDFSEALRSGTEYAAQLAKKMSASLTLLYVRLSIWPEAIQLEEEAKKSNESISEWLADFAKEVRNEFGVPCHHYIDQTTHTFAEAVATQALMFDLIVMGTNGADNAYDYVFGSNTFHVIEKTSCPVVVVPEGYAFRPIERMVYAYDPDSNPIFLIDQIKKVATTLEAEIRVLYIDEKKPSSESQRKMEILHDAIQARLANKIQWSFDSHHSQDVWWTLDQYMKANNGDTLALFFHHRSLMQQFFNENVVKKITMVADYPVFVFWN